MDQSFVIKLKFDRFQRWVSEGIGVFRIEEEININPELEKNTDIDQLELLLEIPLKYRQYVEAKTPVYVLIDEVICISLLTQELTDEWKSKMHNLGESWLPFEYHPEWLNFPAVSLKERDNIADQPDAILETIITGTSEPINSEDETENNSENAQIVINSLAVISQGLSKNDEESANLISRECDNEAKQISFLEMKNHYETEPKEGADD